MKLFKSFGILYYPISMLGYVVTIAAILFLIPIYTAIVRNGHSVSDDLYKMFIYTSCVIFWFNTIAAKTCDDSK